jgi:hypothetical protein
MEARARRMAACAMKETKETKETKGSLDCAARLSSCSAHPCRWVGERSFARLVRKRRIDNDDERKVHASATLIEVALIEVALIEVALIWLLVAHLGGGQDVCSPISGLVHLGAPHDGHSAGPDELI